MTLQEKIQKKAEGFGKLAPVFLEEIRQAVLEHYNARAKHHGAYEADNIVITSSTVLDPLSAVQLASDTPNVIKIEDNGNSAAKH